MFGFLAPQRRILEWRQAYARICQFQRRLYGLTSLPFLSYEATFLYRLAIDFKLLPELPQSAAECCRLKRLGNADNAPDFQAASFAATFGVVLAGINCRMMCSIPDAGSTGCCWQNINARFAMHIASWPAQLPGLKSKWPRH